MSADARHKWIFTKVAETLGVDAPVVQDAVSRSNKLGIVTEFFKETSPRKLLFYYQPPQAVNEYGETVTQADAKPKLFVTDGQQEALRGKCVYFLRVTAKSVTPARIEEEVIYGQIEQNVLEELQESLNQVSFIIIYDNMLTFG